MMTPPTIAERVAAGVAWLDTNAPGWVQDIEDELDMSSCVRCVMGQIYGHYWDSPMDGNNEEAIALGFLATTDLPDAEESESTKEAEEAEYADLTSEWVRVISERRTQSGGES